MDPYNGNGRIPVDKDLLADRYASMGSQAVVTSPGGFFPVNKRESVVSLR